MEQRIRARYEIVTTLPAAPLLERYVVFGKF
jgi:hypothetical protein